MRKLWAALTDGWTRESLLDELPKDAGQRRRRPSRRLSASGWQWHAPAGRAAIASAVLALLGCAAALAAPLGGSGRGGREIAHVSGDPATFSFTAPQLIDGQYPYALPNGFDSLSCASPALCVGTTFGSGVIVSSTDPTGNSTSDWSVLSTSLLAQDASGYSLAGASCVTAGASPFCITSGSNSANTTNPGLVLTATNPTAGASGWQTTTLPLTLTTPPSCSSTSPPTCITAGFPLTNSLPSLFVSSNPGSASPNWTKISPAAFQDGASVPGVACPSTSLCAAIDSDDHYVASLSPTSTNQWTIASTPGLSNVTSLSCPTASFCLAAGYEFVNNAFVEQIATTTSPTAPSWHLTTTTEIAPFSSVSCSTRTNSGLICLAPDASGGVAVSTTPDAVSPTWTKESVAAATGTLSALACASNAALCLAGSNLGNVVNSGNASTPATATWSSPVLSVAGGNSPVALTTQSCPSSSLCVGSDGAGRILTSTNPAGGGPTWSSAIVDTSSPNNQIRKVDCPSISLCIAVDNAGNVLESSNPAGGASTWSAPKPIDAGKFMELDACPSSGLCVALDSAGNVLDSTNPAGGASTWTAATSIDPNGRGFAKLACPSTGLCVALDNSGNVLTSTNPAGGGWSSPTSIDSGGAPFTQLACPSVSLCVATDFGGNVLTSTNPGAGTWSTPSLADSSGSLAALDCPSASLCTALDSKGNVLTSTNPSGGGSTWSAPVAIDSGGGGSPQLTCPSNLLCVADDHDGNVLVSTNPAGGAPTWSARQAIDPTALPNGLACPSIALCVVSDDSGDVITATSTPSVSAVNPSSGPAAGGTSVTITGANLSGASAVNFGPNPAQAFTVDSSGQIAAISPPGSGAVDVTVTTPGGTSATSLADQFSYTASPSPPMPTAPAVLPGPPAVLSSTSAAFSGSVDPEGLPTTAYFEYGLDPKYSGSAGPVVYSSSTPMQQVGSGFLVHTVTATVPGLVPNALYHVRLVAGNSAGTVTGADQTFMTKKDPPPGRPELGRSFDVSVVSGLVFFKLPGVKRQRDSGLRSGDLAHAALTKGAGFVPLTEARQLPAGTQIDARQGTMALTAASGTTRGKLQTGTFGGGLFGLAQDKRGITKGLTTLSLLEGAFSGAPTYASCSAKKAIDNTFPSAYAALSGSVLQTLHASAHGKFRTRGRYSAATVRGTVWTTIDRCDGTLTTVQRDTVAVQDFVRHVTVLVRAGHSYLARAPARRRK